MQLLLLLFEPDHFQGLLFFPLDFMLHLYELFHLQRLLALLLKLASLPLPFFRLLSLTLEFKNLGSFFYDILCVLVFFLLSELSAIVQLPLPATRVSFFLLFLASNVVLEISFDSTQYLVTVSVSCDQL